MRFEFATAHRIIFGQGAVREVAPAAREMGQRALLVTGKTAGRAAPLVESLQAAGMECVRFATSGEPTVERVREGVESARKARCDLVIGFGGGSAVDAAKAIAALLTNPGDVMDYLEIIGGGKPLSVEPAPWIAIPTTAGTGAEVTRNAVLASPRHKLKVSLRSPRMLPRLAVVDPELTLDLPPEVTAASGLDALTQLIESFVSVKANALTDGFSVEGLRRASRALPRAYHDGQDAQARAEMSQAALLGGLALANAGLGVVHGFASPLGGMYDAPHGALCAALLAGGMEVNIRALRDRAPESEALRRYQRIAHLLTGDHYARPEAGVQRVRELCREMKVRPLSAYGVGVEDFAAIAEKASRANSMKGNPIQLTAAELHEVLKAASE
ncbi:MAG: iron-containing alcohol dehydrogenase [Terriglobia bacterium]